MALLDGMLGQIMGNQSGESGLDGLMGNPQVLKALVGLLSTRDASIYDSGGLAGLISAFQQ